MTRIERVMRVSAAPDATRHPDEAAKLGSRTEGKAHLRSGLCPHSGTAIALGIHNAPAPTPRMTFDHATAYLVVRSALTLDGTMQSNAAKLSVRPPQYWCGGTTGRGLRPPPDNVSRFDRTE